MGVYKIALSGALALLLLAACERPSAVAKKDEPSSRASSSSSSSSDYGSDTRSARRDTRDQEVRELDGKPIWSASRRGTAEENAQRSFERNGADFDAKTIDAFIRKAHAFVENPPAGTQRQTRSNGDTMLYDAKSNVFAVVNRDGAPRTMFKPDDGQSYWDQQKSRESRRTASADRGERNGGE